MAIDNVLFPNPPMIHGFQKEVMIPTNVASNGNREFRIRKQANERYIWSWPGSTMEDDDLRALIKFQSQREGALKAFKFQDPDYPTFNDALLEYSGSTTDWYLRIPFDASTVGVHKIFNIDLGNTTVTVDGVSGNISSGQLNSAGEPTITVDGTNGSEVVRITGPCYFSARFDANIAWTLAHLNSDNTPNISIYNEIKLIEVFEDTF